MHLLVTLRKLCEQENGDVCTYGAKIRFRARKNDLHETITIAVCSGNNSGTVHKDINAYRDLFPRLICLCIYQCPFLLLLGK
jgi:hypothetical protein